MGSAITSSFGIWHFIVFNIAIIFMLALDLGVFHKRAHAPSYQESIGWSLVWFVLAILFAVWLYVDHSQELSVLFLTGYAVEKSLSLDNVMVFGLIFSSLKIPLKYQHRVLFWGVLGALVMRALMIFLGYALIMKFHFILYVFGGFLILTGLKILFIKEKDQPIEDTFLYRKITQYVPFTHEFNGQKFLTTITENGVLKRVGTPLLIALVFVEISDVVFAVDSIPAIFAITQDPFIIYTSNVFAILGLRSLYFMLGRAIDQFHYLKPALGIVLVFVGVKMFQWIKFAPEISLMIIGMLLIGGVILSRMIPQKPKS